MGGEAAATLAQWIAECIARGRYLLSSHNNFVSAAYTEGDITRTWEIADRALAALT